MTLVLVLLMLVSGVGALSNVDSKYSSAMVFASTLLCTTALLITGIIKL